MSKPVTNDLIRKMSDIRNGESSPDLHRIGSNYYTDENGQVFKARSLQQIEAHNKRQYIERASQLRSQKHYVNCYHEPIKEIMSELKLHELGAVTKLLPFLRFNNGGLLVKEGKAMTAADISKVIGKSKRQADNILAKLIEAGVIIKEGVKRGVKYYVAEEYHTIGKTHEGVTYTKLYQKETRLRADKLSIQEAGLLYKMLPYFHYENYFLCVNPDARESDGETIDHLNQAQLAELIGESHDTVERGIKALMAHGFLMKISGYNTSRILVNPDVMFRAQYESEYTQTVRMQFAELERGASEVH